MASVTIGGAQSYTIPLDSIDLRYLSKYVRSPLAETRPLWTRKCLDGESEYCHVQIVIQDDNEDCYSEPFDEYKCHICNVRVPTMCYKEHNESEQHETNMKISQKFLESVSKEINISIINNDEDIVKDLYFCVSCSKIIRIENIYRHESSAYHVKSEKNITIISEFYKILTENESCDDGNDLCNNCDSDDSSVDQSPVTESFEKYLKEMNKKYNLKVDLPVINGEYISIVAPNGETVKVSREHFQSYRQIKSSVYCQLCKMWISQDTRPHDVTETHVRNILKPINEKFARAIDTVSSHCVPCNEVVLTNSNHQTLNDSHKNNDSTEIFWYNKKYNDATTTNNKKQYSEVCKVKVPTGGMKIHVDGKPQKKAISQLCSENKTDTTPKENKAQSGAKPGSVAQSGSSVNTNTKNVRFAGTAFTSSAESSLNVSDHKIDAYYDLLEYTNATGTEVRCKVCFVNIVTNQENIIEHMESTPHKFNNMLAIMDSNVDSCK